MLGAENERVNPPSSPTANGRISEGQSKRVMLDYVSFVCDTRSRRIVQLGLRDCPNPNFEASTEYDDCTR